ncbi:hypothetical protein GKS22_01165 [Streptococcus uberis]|uniref:polysaccharide biosynthesis C-terminal domain-containing protein n=1 Tax=Streptococcus uberis TaxID=1349 RepID=UPI0012B5DA3B|nr:polysaccharide biosynthesis C-terminal domain-containing protein [Streptococcus uberis]MTB42341.1 hypothetical protein [Streptococcus uberis]MTB98859.1 hypothetical protein [Streptococcus uberis]
MNKIKIILKNEYIFSISTRILIALSGLFTQVIASRYLGAELKGQTAYILSFTNLSSIVFLFGLSSLYPSFRTKSIDKKVAVDEYMTISTIIFSLYYVIIVISTSILKIENLEINTALLLTPIYCYSSVSGMVALVENPNKRNRGMLFIGFFELLIIFLLFIFTKKSFLFGVVTICAAEIMKVCYFISILKFNFNINLIKKETLKYILENGLVLMISALLITLSYKINILMLKYFKNISLAEIGVYSVGISIAEKTFLIPDAIKEILLSRLSKNINEKEVAKMARISFAIGLIVSVVIAVFSYPLISILFGNEFKNAFGVTSITVFGVSFIVFMKMIDSYNQVMLLQKANIIMLLISIIFNISINFYFIPNFGIYGAAFSMMLSYICSGFLFVVFFNIRTKIPITKIIFLQKDDYKFILDLINFKINRVEK